MDWLFFIAFMFLGAILGVVLGWQFRLSYSNREQEREFSRMVDDAEEYFAEIATNVEEIEAEEEFALAKWKGEQFEKCTVDRFDHEYFKLLEWAGDKYSFEGRYSLRSMQPDLLFRYSSWSKNQLIAVECKWRNSFSDGRIQVMSERSLQNYRKYAEANRRTVVYIALGVGGEPNKPEELFLIPLDKIEWPSAPRHWVAKFSRNPSINFFWDQNESILK